MLAGKHILLIIGGGIAAYKALDLMREIRRAGGVVTPVLTNGGAQFVTPLSVSALSGSKVFEDLFDLTAEAEMGHIELSRAADMILVAPATANLLASMAHGSATDLATTLLLATDKDVMVAPSMNVRMWDHPATQRNLATLKRDGVLVVGPDEGEMACGEYGPGRLAEPAAITAAVAEYFKDGPLIGRRVLVTSGPTHEPIDPVRYIANRSSGAQGTAIGQALARAGAEVIFITGPADVAPPDNVTVVAVQTAAEMAKAVEEAGEVDVAIFAAAVADWRMADATGSKIKKTGGALPDLKLVENPDILAGVAQRETGRPGLVIGFAAETDDVLANATAKHARKGCDWIVANDVSPATGIMGGAENAVTLISHDNVEKWPRMSKNQVAERLIARIVQELSE